MAVNGRIVLDPLPAEMLEGFERNEDPKGAFRTFLNQVAEGFEYIHLNKPAKKKIWKAVHTRTKKKLNRQDRRRLGLYTLGRNEVSFQQMLRVHELWKGYMRELLKLDVLKESNWKNSPEDSNFEQVSVKLYRADYHGALMTATESKCPSLIGKSGIVAMETKNCLKLIGEDNKCRTIPKQGCKFEFAIDDFRFSFYGKNLITRPAERSNRKIKLLHAPCL